jgi:hypothetical protein
MRRFILLALVFGSLAQSALADPVTYDIHFTAYVGPLPTSGSFTWDGQQFSDFLIMWSGVTYNFTGVANDANFPPMSSSCPSALRPQFSFELLTGQCGSDLRWDARKGSVPAVYFEFFAIDLDTGMAASLDVLSDSDTVFSGALGSFESVERVVQAPELPSSALLPVGLVWLVAVRKRAVV